MHKLSTALVWLLVIGAGYGGFELYKWGVARGRTTTASRLADYRQTWEAVLTRVGAEPPPSPDDVVNGAPLGEQDALRQKLAKIDKEYLPKYEAKEQQILDELLINFKEEWQNAIDTFADTPPVEDFLKSVHECHHAKLRARLAPLDDELKKKHPRTKLAIDSFSGYCVFRSEEFRARLTAARPDIKLHLADDGADYKKRIQTLQSGETPLAVFTLDALINNSALFDSPPAAVVMLIDETRGADAMVAYKDALPNLDALNRPDLKIVLTPDSPSETLARLVRSEFKLPKLAKECFVPAKDAEDVFKRFREAGPTEPQAFVLWEPYVSKLLRQYPRAHVLIDSSRFSGYIVDVLVAQKKYLQENPDEVDAVVRAYLEAAAVYQRSPQDMARLVRADSKKLADADKLPEPLTTEEAEKVVHGIAWKTTPENYGHLGLLPPERGAHLLPVEEMVKNIGGLLIKTRAISRPVKPALFYDRSVCARLHEAGFDPGGAVAMKPAAPTADGADVWGKLRRVGMLEVEPITFQRGSAALPAEAEGPLGELVEKMKTLPEYYLEIRGHARGMTNEDRDLARERAEAVAKWLRDKGGLEPQRLRAVGMEQSAEQAAVTFVVLEPPRAGR
jgi:hypothetical protein